MTYIGMLNRNKTKYKPSNYVTKDNKLDSIMNNESEENESLKEPQITYD